MFLHWFKKRGINNLAGLDINSESLKLLKINSTQFPYQVENFSIVSLPSGVIHKNEIKEMNVAGEALKDLVHSSDLKTKNVAISIPKSSTITKTITVDHRLTPDEIESRAWIEANRHFPDLVGDIHLDFAILGPSVEERSQLELLLIACRKEQLKPYFELLKLAGLTAKIVDVHNYALERALSVITDKAQPLKTIASLNLDFDLSTLIVSNENNLIYAHDQSFDGHRLTAQTQKFLEDQKSLTPANEASYMSILKESMGAHLRHTMHFFYSSRPNVSIQKVFLNGDCALIPKLGLFIQEELGIETCVTNPFNQMEIATSVNKEELQKSAPRLMLCCGLALSKIK